MAKEKILKFDPIEIQSVEFKTITVKAPNFKEAKAILAGVNFDEKGGLSPDSLAIVSERTLLLCGTSPNGPVIQELIDQLPYKTVMEAGMFSLSFM